MRPEEDQLIEELFRRYYAALCTYARLQLNDGSVAEDMVQDAFHEAVNHIDALTRHTAPEKWLFRTLKNKIRNYERTRMRMLKHLISVEDVSQTPASDSVEAQVIQRDAAPPLARIRELLGEDDFCFLMRLTVGKASHKDMAEELGITVWASTKRLSRIRDKLAKEFPDYRRRQT